MCCLIYMYVYVCNPHHHAGMCKNVFIVYVYMYVCISEKVSIPIYREIDDENRKDLHIYRLIDYMKHVLRYAIPT